CPDMHPLAAPPECREADAGNVDHATGARNGPLHRFLVADIGLEADDLADIPLRHQRQGAFRVANGDADLVSPRPKPLNQMPADKARASENGNQLTRHSSFPLISGSDKDNALLYRHCPDIVLILS